MKILRYSLLALVIGASTPARVNAQIDPHFSQYYANPLWLNPAMTGVIDGRFRVTANFKQQWSALSNAYTTSGISADIAPRKNLSLGLMVLNQNAGELNFNYLTALASASYRVSFGEGAMQFLSFGLQGGLIHRSFDASAAVFGDQYDPAAGWVPTQGGEGIMERSSTVPDFNFGFMYFDGNQARGVNPFLGGSAAHLTQPTERFMGVSRKIPMRFIGHGGARIRVSNSIDITPNALFMRQGDAQELAFGAYAQMSVNPSATLMLGGNYRTEDAGIAFIGVQYKNMVFGFSYDINTSSLRNATRSNGGLELSGSYIGRDGLIAPNFFCPRL